MTPKQLAHMLIDSHLKVGRLSYSDAIECAIITCQYAQYHDVIIELKYIRAQHQQNLIEINSCHA